MFVRRKKVERKTLGVTQLNRVLLVNPTSEKWFAKNLVLVMQTVQEKGNARVNPHSLLLWTHYILHLSSHIQSAFIETH